MFEVFHRTWWRNNPDWPNGLEPSVGEETVIKRNVPTIEEARSICKAWNDSHEAGRLSRKAEFWGQ